MLASLWTYRQIALGALLGALIGFGPVYLYGASHGRQQAALAAVKETARAYRERTTADEKIRALDPIALCVELGGVLADCEQQLRGLGKNPAETSKRSLSGRK